jgi:hypothetical protein
VEDLEDVGSPVSGILYPTARVNIIDAIEALSDPEYQWRVWIRREYPRTPYYDDLSQGVHILFDDWVVLPDPEPAVDGYIYRDEVAPLRALGEVYDPLITHLGDVSDERYITDPRWPEVVRRAQVALEVMRRNDAQFGTGFSEGET